MQAAVAFDLAHLFAHPGAEQRLFIDESDAYQITALASQAPGAIAQVAHVRFHGRHAYLQRRAVTPRTVIIASHAPETDSVQLSSRKTLRFQQR
ncbi:hypothetical protein D9M69_458100 [compost metagenome]